MSFQDLISHFVLKFLAVPPTPRIQPGKRLLACIGDSITFGAGVMGKPNKTWEYFLNQSLGESWQVINYGISGRTLQDEGDYPYKRDKFYRISLRSRAEIYLIMLGTNDAKPYNWDRERYERELRQFAQAYFSLENRPRVILMTPPCCFEEPQTGIVAFDISKETIDRETAPLVRETAEALGLQLIDLHAFTTGHVEWFTDGVHPNEEGNRAIARFLAEQIRLD